MKHPQLVKRKLIFQTPDKIKHPATIARKESEVSLFDQDVEDTDEELDKIEEDPYTFSEESQELPELRPSKSAVHPPFTQSSSPAEGKSQAVLGPAEIEKDFIRTNIAVNREYGVVTNQTSGGEKRQREPPSANIQSSDEDSDSEGEIASTRKNSRQLK